MGLHCGDCGAPVSRRAIDYVRSNEVDLNVNPPYVHVRCRPCRLIVEAKRRQLAQIATLVSILWERAYLSEPVGVPGFSGSFLPHKPAPKELECPKCWLPHFDIGEWLTRLHKTHKCAGCGHEWRPFNYYTVGV